MTNFQDLLHLGDSLEDVIFYGDPHGDWEPLKDAIQDSTHTVLILGDLLDGKCHPEHIEQTRRAVQEITASGVAMHFIPGNHDTDSDAIYELVFEELRENLLHGEVRSIGAGSAQCRVAGLGGVIRGRVWNGEDHSHFHTPEELLARRPKREHFKGGLPRLHRSTIFPSVVDTLAQSHADILLTHEAPSSHGYGFGFIDKLGQDMQAKLIVHGHQHDSYKGELASGIYVRGLGLAEVWEPYKELKNTNACLPDPGS